MTPAQADLWQRVRDFPIDGPERPSLPFAARLARENGWPPAYAERVVAEYKRFAFLAAVAGHPVTPSEQVDQAWHLHLIYTRSYWDRFCGEALGRPLHHDPTAGGPAEAAKFRIQYEATLASYRHFFGEEPPADIWPPAAVRFGEDLDARRVNLRRNWVVPKAGVRWLAATFGALLVGALWLAVR